MRFTVPMAIVVDVPHISDANAIAQTHADLIVGDAGTGTVVAAVNYGARPFNELTPEQLGERIND